MSAPSFVEVELWTNDTRRHWSPSSQEYAPADVLVRFLSTGWKVSPVVGLEEHYHAGVRRVDVYHFELVKGDKQQILPVQSNPVVRRLIAERGLRVVLLKQDKHPASEAMDV